MKRCFVMFAFLILMLLLAVLTDKTSGVIVNEEMVENELAIENQLTNGNIR